MRSASLIAALALAAAACGGTGAPRTAGTSPAALARCEPEGLVGVGEPVPADCEFERLDGGTLTLGGFAGRPLLINFWASWCTYCIDEMPDLQAVYGDVSDRMEFVGMDLLHVDGETRGAARSFAGSTGARYPLAYDPGGLLYAHFSQRRVMPTTVFVKADGTVAHRQFGPLREEQVRDLLDERLGVD